MRIFDYAKVADWDDRVSILAGMAEPERWTDRSVPSESPLPVLDGYVRHTFLHLHAQGKLAEIDELACFNTGLLTPGQEEIFGVCGILGEEMGYARPGVIVSCPLASLTASPQNRNGRVDHAEAAVRELIPSTISKGGGT